jgi:hypothetical protein
MDKIRVMGTENEFIEVEVKDGFTELNIENEEGNVIMTLSVSQVELLIQELQSSISTISTMKSFISYELYQVQDEKTRDYGFMRYAEYKKFHSMFQLDLVYNKVYTGPIFNFTDHNDILDKLFQRFNWQHPHDFEGRSMSASDIVKLDNKYYYVDFVGFKDVTEEVVRNVEGNI